MATVTTAGQLTLVELAKRSHNKNFLMIAEVLNETNEVVEDIPWVEGNDVTSHLYTKRISLPSGSWREFNAGVASESSETAQVREEMGMLESYSKVDKALADISPNPKEFRTTEDLAFVEGMGQNFVDTLFYGSQITTPQSFTGLTPRYNALSLDNVQGAGGSGGDETSVWHIQWAKDKVFCCYPKGSKTAGVQARDLGEDTLTDADGNEFQGYRTHFKISGGLVIRDDRCVQRVCNCEQAGATNIWDEDLSIRALNNMLMRGRGAITYANRAILTEIDIIAKDKTNVNYTPGEVFGRPTMFFRGSPVKLVEALVDEPTVA